MAEERQLRAEADQGEALAVLGEGERRQPARLLFRQRHLPSADPHPADGLVFAEVRAGIERLHPLPVARPRLEDGHGAVGSREHDGGAVRVEGQGHVVRDAPEDGAVEPQHNVARLGRVGFHRAAQHMIDGEGGLVEIRLLCPRRPAHDEEAGGRENRIQDTAHEVALREAHERETRASLLKRSALEPPGVESFRAESTRSDSRVFSSPRRTTAGPHGKFILTSTVFRCSARIF